MSQLIDPLSISHTNLFKQLSRPQFNAASAARNFITRHNLQRITPVSEGPFFDIPLSSPVSTVTRVTGRAIPRLLSILSRFGLPGLAAAAILGIGGLALGKFLSTEHKEHLLTENLGKLKVIKPILANPEKFEKLYQGSFSAPVMSKMVRSTQRTSKFSKPSSAPVAISYQVKETSKPKFKPTRFGGVRVSHTELVAPLLSSGTTLTYNVNGYRVNPGISSLFPWLSSIAGNYEKYKFINLEFVFVPICSTSTAGRAGVGFDYDSSDVLPGNRQEFFQLTAHSESAPWQDFSLSIKCDNVLRFCGGSSSNTDPKLLDLGQAILYTDQVVTTNQILGDVYVKYCVEFHEPQQAQFATQAFRLSIAGGLSIGTDLLSNSNNQSFGPSIVRRWSLAANNDMRITMSNGTYAAIIQLNFTTGTTGEGAHTLHSGTGSVNIISQVYGTSFAVLTLLINVTSAEGVVRVSWSGPDLTSANAYQMWISRVAAPVYYQFV